MAKKTYVPKFIQLLKTVCRYIVRWQVVLTAGLTAYGVNDAAAKVAAVVAACEAIVLDVEFPVMD